MQDNRFLIRERETGKVLGRVYSSNDKKDVQKYIDDLVYFWTMAYGKEKDFSYKLRECLRVKYDFHRVPNLDDYTEENTIYY